MSFSRPTLPPTVDSVKLRSLSLAGGRFSVRYTAAAVFFTAEEASKAFRMCRISSYSTTTLVFDFPSAQS